MNAYFEKLDMLISVNYVMLSVITVVLSVMLMYRFRNRFHGLYTDYGRSLWKGVIIHIIALSIGTTFFLLYSYCYIWIDFWIQNDAREITLETLTSLFTFIVPMIPQLSCLFFGYIRHKKAPYSLEVRPSYISYFDPIVEYYTNHGL